MCSGYVPFGGNDTKQTLTYVKRGIFDFKLPSFDKISQSCKDLIRLMMKFDPKNRPTAAEALQHKWFQERLQIKDSIKY